MDSFSAQHVEIKSPPRRRRFYSPGLLLRILFALIVGFLIVMAFFATSALSH